MGILGAVGSVATQQAINAKKKTQKPKVRTCRVCGCTDNDCRQCIEKTGHPCYWVENNLCSACVSESES